MSRTQQRILLAMGAALAAVAVFVAALFALRGGDRQASGVRIQLTKDAPTAKAAQITPTRAPATATATRTVIAPTQTRAPSPTETRTSTTTPSPSPTPSPEPSRTPTSISTPPSGRGPSLPDLTLQNFSVASSGVVAGTVQVQIANAGPGDLVNTAVEILGIDQTGAAVLHTTTPPLNLPAGRSISVTTSFKPLQRTMLTVVLNPNHTIAESDAPAGFDDTNNTLTKAVLPP
jgi:hypothetical protein